MKYWKVLKVYYCKKFRRSCVQAEAEYLDYYDQPDIDCSKCTLKEKDIK